MKNGFVDEVYRPRSIVQNRLDVWAVHLRCNAPRQHETRSEAEGRRFGASACFLSYLGSVS